MCRLFCLLVSFNLPNPVQYCLSSSATILNVREKVVLPLWCFWSSSVGLWQDPDEMYELKSPSLTFNCDESSQRWIVCSGPESRADSFSYVVQTTSSMVPCAFFFGHSRREAISYKVDYHSLATWHYHSPSHVWKPYIPPVLHLRATVSTRLTWKELFRRLFHARLLIVFVSMIPITAPPPPWLR